MPTTDVSIDLVTDERYITTIGGGGMKIAIDGDRLNRFVNEDETEWSGWRPEYVGDDIATDIWDLVTTTTAVLEERELFAEQAVEFLGSRFRLYVEYLGADTVRIAFRVTEPAHDAEPILRSIPESACGYPVDAEAWAREVFSAGEQFYEQLQELGRETPSSTKGYDDILDELREQIEAFE